VFLFLIHSGLSCLFPSLYIPPPRFCVFLYPLYSAVRGKRHVLVGVFLPLPFFLNEPPVPPLGCFFFFVVFTVLCLLFGPGFALCIFVCQFMTYNSLGLPVAFVFFPFDSFLFPLFFHGNHGRTCFYLVIFLDSRSPLFRFFFGARIPIC